MVSLSKNLNKKASYVWSFSNIVCCNTTNNLFDNIYSNFNIFNNPDCFSVINTSQSFRQFIYLLTPRLLCWHAYFSLKRQYSKNCGYNKKEKLKKRGDMEKNVAQVNVVVYVWNMFKVKNKYTRQCLSHLFLVLLLFTFNR